MNACVAMVDHNGLCRSLARMAIDSADVLYRGNCSFPASPWLCENETMCTTGRHLGLDDSKNPTHGAQGMFPRISFIRGYSVVAVLALAASLVSAAEQNPLAQYLEVPGAKTTLPVAAVKLPWPFDFAKSARKNFNNFHYQLGGDHALY